MGVDIQVYRCRFEMFNCGAGPKLLDKSNVFSDVACGISAVCAVCFIGILLIMAGVEPNPGPPGTHERNNPLCKNWNRVAYGYRNVMKTGLTGFISGQIGHRHNLLKLEVGQKSKPCSGCTITTLLPDHRTDGCNQGSICLCQQDPCRRQKCPNNFCGHFYHLIVDDHVKNSPSWSNTDSTKWYADHFQYAKCFLTTVTSASSVSELDCAELLTIVIHNKHIRNNSIQEVASFEQCWKDQDIIFNSCNFEVTDSELKDYFDHMIKVLKDGKCLFEDSDAMQAVKELNKLKNTLMQLSDEDIDELLQKTIAQSPGLFTQMFTEQSAGKYQPDLFNQTGPFTSNSGTSLFDLTKHNFVEEVRSLQILTQWAKSVGILKSPRGTCTCFRVGSKYIMTALHGIRQMIEPEFRELQNNDTDWRIDLRNLCRLDTFVDFEYLTEGGHIETDKFFFKLDGTTSVPFYDESTDSIVLELECDKNHQLPPPFETFGLPNLNHKFSLVHHAGGLSKKVKPVDKIVDMASHRTRTDIQTIQQLSETFLNDNGIDVERFCCERPPFGILGNRDRLLFHCASNKGAAGCPGILVTKDGTVVVVTMLLCGYPDWYYAPECQTVANLWSKSDTVEQGVNFASIYVAMKHNNPRLSEDVFNIRRSRTVQPISPDS